MAAPEPATRAFLKLSHEFALWMIQLADAKASVLMAASAILAGLLIQQPFPTCNGQARYVSLFAAGLALASVGACVMTLFPRTRPEGHSSLLYFRAILGFRTGSEYLTRVQGLT